MNTKDEWSGIERRERGRVVYSQGPIIRSLELLSAVAGLCAIVALVFALVAFNGRLSDIQKSRAASDADTCYLFRQVITLASSPRHVREGEVFLRRAGLGNCKSFGIQHTRVR